VPAQIAHLVRLPGDAEPHSAQVEGRGPARRRRGGRLPPLARGRQAARRGPGGQLPAGGPGELGEGGDARRRAPLVRPRGGCERPVPHAEKGRQGHLRVRHDPRVGEPVPLHRKGAGRVDELSYAARRRPADPGQVPVDLETQGLEGPRHAALEGRLPLGPSLREPARRRREDARDGVHGDLGEGDGQVHLGRPRRGGRHLPLDGYSLPEELPRGAQVEAGGIHHGPALEHRPSGDGGLAAHRPKEPHGEGEVVAPRPDPVEGKGQRRQVDAGFASALLLDAQRQGGVLDPHRAKAHGDLLLRTGGRGGAPLLFRQAVGDLRGRVRAVAVLAEHDGGTAQNDGGELGAAVEQGHDGEADLRLGNGEEALLRVAGIPFHGKALHLHADAGEQKEGQMGDADPAARLLLESGRDAGPQALEGNHARRHEDRRGEKKEHDRRRHRELSHPRPPRLLTRGAA